MGKPENKVENYIQGLADKHGFLYYKFTSPSRAGVMDRILIGHGQTIFVEVKAPGENPRELQIKTMENIIAHDGIAVVIDSESAADKLISLILRYELSDDGKISKKHRFDLKKHTGPMFKLRTSEPKPKKPSARKKPVLAVFPTKTGIRTDNV